MTRLFFFQNGISFSNVVPNECSILHETGPVQKKNTHLGSTVDTDGLVLSHQGISSYSADYASACFQMLMG